MNMILHGIEAPNILHTNTLTENLADIQEKDRFDVVLANPPFGGKERKEVQQNFPIRTGETAYLFLQHFIRILKAGGRAGIVIKNTFLSNTDNASVSLRKMLLEGCNLHTVLDCPGGTFQPASPTAMPGRTSHPPTSPTPTPRPTPVVLIIPIIPLTPIPANPVPPEANDEQTTRQRPYLA